jgi:hypothetical protein
MPSRRKSSIANYAKCLHCYGLLGAVLSLPSTRSEYDSPTLVLAS